MSLRTQTMGPRFKIDAHVFYYSVAFISITGVALGYANTFGKSEAEKIAELETRYADKLKGRQQKRQELQEFFDKMKNKDKDDLDKKFDLLLKGGKEEVKRQGPNVREK